MMGRRSTYKREKEFELYLRELLSSGDGATVFDALKAQDTEQLKRGHIDD
jgi:hypothetical protein